MRTAIDGASDGDTIDLSGLACSLITLQSGALVSPVANLSLVGPGVDVLTIDAGNANRVLKGASLDIADLTIAHGVELSGYGGGCILATGDLALTRAKVSSCSTVNINDTALGGGVLVLGNLTMHSSTIASSKADGAKAAAGGGAFVSGTPTLYDSVISGNTAEAAQASAYGGGLVALSDMTLHGSSVDGNEAHSAGASAYGGGLHSAYSGISVLDGSTISNNRADSDSSPSYGGGVSSGVIANPSPAMVMIDHSTISGNTADATCNACLISGGGVHAIDSIVAVYSTVSYNEALCDDPGLQCSTGGGGLAATGQSTASSITLRSTTISGNHSTGGSDPAAFSAGGGIMGGLGLRIVAHNSTIAFNDAATLGGGIAATSSASTPSELVSTIVADNHSGGGAGDIVAGPFGNDLVLEGSNNMVTAAGAGVTLPGDTSTDEPLLLPLTTANGGVTATHALAAGSPAIDTGSNPDAFLFD
ncbi:MAG: choice-of-anchor Q domain-containing protein, partial [Rhodanobacteraceae bacterium]